MKWWILYAFWTGLLFWLASFLPVCCARVRAAVRKRRLCTGKDAYCRGEVRYETYFLSLPEYLWYGGLYFLGSGLAGVLFFQNPLFGLFPAIVFLPLFFSRLRRRLQQKRVRSLEKQFYHSLQLLSASLSVGIPLEKCFRDVAESDACRLQSDMGMIRREFEKIDRLLTLQTELETAFDSFAQRSASRDIQSFSVALRAAAFSGGNLVELVRLAAASYQMKEAAEEEIRSCLSLPRMNHKIMTAMPFFLIGLLRCIAPGYLSPLYTGAGRLVMLTVVAVLAGAWFLGEKVSDISF